MKPSDAQKEAVSVINEREAGASVADLARMLGVAEQSIHRWKSKHGGMTVSDLKRIDGGEPAPEAHGRGPEPGHADARGRHRKVVTPAASMRKATFSPSFLVTLPLKQVHLPRE